MLHSSSEADMDTGEGEGRAKRQCSSEQRYTLPPIVDMWEAALQLGFRQWPGGDQSFSLKQIEINTISASFGGLAQQLPGLHRWERLSFQKAVRSDDGMSFCSALHWSHFLFQVMMFYCYVSALLADFLAVMLFDCRRKWHFFTMMKS